MASWERVSEAEATLAAAERLFSSRALWRLGRDRGLYVPLPSPQEAAYHHLTTVEHAHLERLKARSIWGTPARVGALLRALAAELEVEEVAILSTVHDPAARQRSYTLLAEEFGLTANPVATAVY